MAQRLRMLGAQGRSMIGFFSFELRGGSWERGVSQPAFVTDWKPDGAADRLSVWSAESHPVGDVDKTRSEVQMMRTGSLEWDISITHVTIPTTRSLFSTFWTECELEFLDR